MAIYRPGICIRYDTSWDDPEMGVSEIAPGDTADLAVYIKTDVPFDLQIQTVIRAREAIIEHFAALGKWQK